MNPITDTSHFWLYFLLVAGIVLLPGMDMAFVMSRALVGGRRAGAAAVAGIVAGGMVHVAVSSLGIGLILLSAPRLFNAMMAAGALYVGWMGWSLLRGAHALGAVREGRPLTLWASFGGAVATCLLNPKAYVFMLAVFPQFLRAEYGSLAVQALALAAITAFTQIVIYGGVAAGAAGLRGWLLANAQAQVALGRSVGALLLLMALWTAWQAWLRNP